MVTTERRQSEQQRILMRIKAQELHLKLRREIKREQKAKK